MLIEVIHLQEEQLVLTKIEPTEQAEVLGPRPDTIAHQGLIKIIGVLHREPAHTEVVQREQEVQLYLEVLRTEVQVVVREVEARTEALEAVLETINPIDVLHHEVAAIVQEVEVLVQEVAEAIEVLVVVPEVQVAVQEVLVVVPEVRVAAREVLAALQDHHLAEDHLQGEVAEEDNNSQSYLKYT